MSKFFDILLTIQSRLTFISPSSEGPHKKIIPSQKPPSIRTIPIPHPYNAQLARCLSRGLSLQEPTEIIQLIKYPPTLFNISHFPKGCVPRFSISAQTKPLSLSALNPYTMKYNITYFFLSRFFGNFILLKHQYHVTEIEPNEEMHEAFPSSGFCKKRNWLFSPDLPMSHSFRGGSFFLSRFRLRRVPRALNNNTQRSKDDQQKHQAGGATSSLPAPPTRNRRKRQNQAISKIPQ